MADYIGFRATEHGPVPAEMPALPGRAEIDLDDLMTTVATKINTLECNLVMV